MKLAVARYFPIYMETLKKYISKTVSFRNLIFCKKLPINEYYLQKKYEHPKRRSIMETNMDGDERESDAESGGFTLSIDLTPCVGAQARCRIWVRRRDKLRGLARRVRQAARLRGPLLLRAGNDLLPPGESIRVLRSNDKLSVARIEHEWQQAFKYEDSDEEATEAATIEQQNSSVKSPTENLDTQPLPVIQQSSESGLEPVHSVQKELVLQPAFEPRQKRIHTVWDDTDITACPTGQAFQTTLKWKHTAEEPRLLGISTELKPDEEEALKRVKQRALAMLEQVTEDEQNTDVVDGSKKKRRRVRKRRRPAPKDWNQEFEEPENLNSVSRQCVGNNISSDTVPNGKGRENESGLDLLEEDSSETIQNRSGTQILKDSNINQTIDPDSETKTPNSLGQSQPDVTAQSSSALKSFEAPELDNNTSTIKLLFSSSTVDELLLRLRPTENEERLVRNTTPPRAPRAVRAMSTEPTNITKMVEIPAVSII